MFDQPLLLEQIQNSIVTAKEAVHADLAQPEFHHSVLLAHVRMLPEDWKSETRRLLSMQREPALEDILQALSIDIEESGSVPSRLWTYQALLRFAIIVYSIRSNSRSTGPGD